MKESDYKIYLFSYRHDGATWALKSKRQARRIFARWLTRLRNALSLRG